MSELLFLHLNNDWNAEPNAPSPQVAVAGDTVTLSFYLNPFAYEAAHDEMGTLRFTGCSRWRWDSTNDHAWYDGNGRLSGQAPQWGEFYEIIGDGRSSENLDWNAISADVPKGRHFLFYFRDQVFECVAADWSFAREMPVTD